MSVQIKYKGNSVLLVHHPPICSVKFFVWGVIVYFVIFLLFRNFILSLPGLIVVISFIFFVAVHFMERETWCFIDKEDGVIIYKRGGILGSRWHANRMRYRITDIVALEQRRHITRSGDVYELGLVLRGGCLIPLSDGLNFYDFQHYSSEIHRFIGTDKPLKVVDDW